MGKLMGITGIGDHQDEQWLGVVTLNSLELAGVDAKQQRYWARFGWSPRVIVR